MDERTFNKDFKLYPEGISTSRLKKYLDPDNSKSPRILELLKIRGFATNRDDALINTINFCTHDSVINDEPVEDVEKLAIVSESFSKLYPSEGKIEVRFAFRNENEYAIWRKDKFNGDQINQKLQRYFSHE
ncbi:MAG: hypothetical protein Q4Q51_10460 [Eubacteriales bacterium]|nr:hypothetical protein [Eubacteriales bacterium]